MVYPLEKAASPSSRGFATSQLSIEVIVAIVGQHILQVLAHTKVQYVCISLYPCEIHHQICLDLLEM